MASLVVGVSDLWHSKVGQCHRPFAHPLDLRPLPLRLRPQVNSLGKWKTALQMVAMSLLLVLRNADHLMGDHPLCECARRIGQCLQRSESALLMRLAAFAQCSHACALPLWPADQAIPNALPCPPARLQSWSGTTSAPGAPGSCCGWPQVGSQHALPAFLGCLRVLFSPCLRFQLHTHRVCMPWVHAATPGTPHYINHPSAHPAAPPCLPHAAHTRCCRPCAVVPGQLHVKCVALLPLPRHTQDRPLM
jgi:hypothetical protein